MQPLSCFSHPSKRISDGVFPSLSVLLFLALGANAAIAQNNWLVFSSQEPASITVCGDPERFGLTISNIHTSPVTGITITIQMPPGMQYEAGSGVNNGVTEFNITNLNAPVFSVPDLPASGGSVTFLYSATAGCDIIPYVNNGDEANMDITANYVGGFDAFTTPDWNVLFPSISIVSIANQSFTGNVGSTFTRTFTLVNGGNGALYKPFTFSDVSGTGLTITASSPAGVYTGMGTQYEVSISDYSLYGNNDYVWDPGEVITFTITYNILTCSNLGSVFGYRWGCNSQNCQTGSSNGNVVIPANLPNLVFLTTNSQSSCFGLATPNTQSLRIVNNGLAPAMNLTLNIYMFVSGTGYSNAVMSEIDTSSIRIRLGLTGPLVKPVISSVTLNDSTGGTGGARACLQGDGIANVGRFITNVGTLNAGDTLYLIWNVHNCCPTVCNNRDNYFNGWRFTGTYQNQCMTQTYTISETAGRNINHIGVGFNNSASGVSDVDAITPGCVSIEVNNADWTMSGANANSPNAYINPTLASNGAYIEWVVNFPANLTYVPGSAVFQTANNVVWPIMPGYPTFAGGVLRVRYDISQANPATIANWAWIGSSFSYCVLAQCGTSGSGTLVNTMNLVPDPTCACTIPVLCRNYTMNVHCPITCPSGLEFKKFSFWRSSFGQPDYAPQDGIPDGTALDTTQIRIDRAMFGDTLSTYYVGVVRNGASPSYWRKGFIYTTFSEGDRHATVLGATVRIWDASAGIYRTANLTAAQTSMVNDAGNPRSFRICFSPAYLNTIAPGQFPANMTLANGDTVFVLMRYVVSTNIGGATANDAITMNRFYVSNDSSAAAPTTNATTEPAAANRFQCDNWSGAVTLIGYYFENWGPSTVQTASCNNITVSQSYYLSIGPCCSNYNGGNLFPREYRQWSILDSMRLTTPPGYTFISATHTESRTTGTNTSFASPATAITPTAISPTLYNFNIRSRYIPNGGTLQPSDDGFSGTINAVFQPTCAVPHGNGQFYWCNYYSTSPIINIAGAAASSPSECINVPAGNTSNIDTVFYNRPNLNLAAVLPTVEGIDSFVTWDIVLQNLAVGSNASNSWIALQTPPTIQVQSVTDLSTMAVVTPTGGGIYQLGVTNSGANRNYRIRARYSNCNRDSLIVHAGWNCTGYPANRLAYTCNTDTLRLYLVPQVPELLVSIIQAPASSVDLCDAVNYEVQVSNIQPGTAYNNFFYMIAPAGNGLQVVPGTTEILYPTSGSWVALPNPTQVGLYWAWNISNNQPTILANGLRGIREPTINSYRIRFQARTNCNFSSGSRPRFYAQAGRPCGGTVSHFVTAPPLTLTGAASNYNTAVSSVVIDTIRPCAANPNIRIRIINLGPASTGSNDSYTFSIHSGATYQAGSFVGIHNAPVNPNPTSVIVGSERQLTWSLPAGIPAGDSVVFTFRINGQALPCGNNEFESSTTTTSSLTCVTTNTQCQIRVNTGSVTDNLVVEKADLVFPTFDVVWGVGAGLQVDYTFTNTGDSVYAGNNTQFQFYIDADSNGYYSPGDILVGNVNYSGALNPNATYVQSSYLPYTSPIANPHFIVVAAPPTSACLCDSSMAQPLNTTVLPVELLSFAATAVGPNQVRLDWVTTREINSHHFDVERSANATDFAYVGTHNAAGNSNGPLLYSLMDNSPLQGMSYYRLRMVDLDGSVKYSELASIWLSAETGLSAHIFPNPTDGLLTVQLSEPTASIPHFEVYTSTGQRVQAPVRPQGPGHWQLDLGQQPAGVYHLRFSLEGKWIHHKVVVE